MLRHTPDPLTEDQITELWDLFGPPPVLSTENQQSYDKIRAGYIDHYKPTNTLQVRAIREAVDADWEIFRFMRHRTVGIERHFRNFLRDQAFSIQFNKVQARGRPGMPREMDELVALRGVTENTQLPAGDILQREALAVDHNRALQHGGEFFDRLDKWLNSATARRNSALDMLRYGLDRAQDGGQVIDADYKEIEDEQIEHSTEVSNNVVAAQNKSEPARLAKE